MLSYHATCSKVEVDRLKVNLIKKYWDIIHTKKIKVWDSMSMGIMQKKCFLASPSPGTVCLTALSSFSKAAKIPLSSELGIDEFHFNDFSLDNDAMITASLRMFLELGVVQNFKIDYEVRLWKMFVWH